ncbi:MAG: hypothetical protein C5B49_06950 [Bdellovibrio sp.]|nr:MAG: hypothetical protein C5B49_06950 [Bdellovibrio sp.]
MGIGRRYQFFFTALLLTDSFAVRPVWALQAPALIATVTGPADQNSRIGAPDQPPEAAVGGKSVTDFALDRSVGAGKTVLFLAVMAAIDSAYHQALHNPDRLSGKEMISIIYQATGQVANSVSTWGAMPAAWGAGKAGAFILRRVAKENPLKFAAALRTMAMTTIGFAGWEVGSQMADECVGQINNAQAREEAKKFTSLVGGGLSYVFSPSGPASSDNELRRQAASSFVHGCMEAFGKKQNLMRALDRLWRTRVMSGEFGTFLGGMLAAGAIGSVFPGAGNLATMMFFGAYIAMPHSWKDYVGQQMRNVRQFFGKADLHRNEAQLQAFSSNCDCPEGKLSELLRKRDFARDTDLTFEMERYRIALKNFVRPSATEKDRQRASEEAAKVGPRITQRYDKEIALIQKLRKEKATPGSNLDGVFEAEVTRLKSLKGSLDDFHQSLISQLSQRPALKPENEEFREHLSFIEGFYLKGFDERVVLPLGTANSTSCAQQVQMAAQDQSQRR